MNENERIKELREQALRWSGENVDRTLYSIYGIEQMEYRKFAKLIVRECADFVDRAISDGGVDGRAVKEHFGVE